MNFIFTPPQTGEVVPDEWDHDSRSSINRAEGEWLPYMITPMQCQTWRSPRSVDRTNPLLACEGAVESGISCANHRYTCRKEAW
jgi:hypothetical protein